MGKVLDRINKINRIRRQAFFDGREREGHAGGTLNFIVAERVPYKSY
jgi:hypothetical protein